MASASSASARGLLVGLCFAVAVLEGFDIQAMGVAAPKLGPDLGLAPAQMGWVFSVSNIGLVLGASVGGWLADRFGRKPVLIGAVATFALFTLATMAAADFTSLFAARFCAGLGFGAALPNMMAVAADISPPERRASTAAGMFCGMPLGGGLSALVTQALPAEYDWRLLFLIGGLLPLLLVPALALLMPETRPHRADAARPAPRLVSSLFGGGRATPTLLLWAAFLPTTLVLYLILNWLPSLVLAKGLERSLAPQTALAFNFASVAGALIVSRLTDRFGPRWPLSLSYAALIGALALLAGAASPVLVLVLSAAAGFFLLGANYALYGVVAGYYPLHSRGVGAGASIAVGRIGSIVGPLLAGLALAAGANAAQVLALLAPTAAVAGAAVLSLSFVRPKFAD